MQVECEELIMQHNSSIKLFSNSFILISQLHWSLIPQLVWKLVDIQYWMFHGSFYYIIGPLLPPELQVLKKINKRTNAKSAYYYLVFYFLVGSKHFYCERESLLFR